jgi:hypothetical protein
VVLEVVLEVREEQEFNQPLLMLSLLRNMEIQAVMVGDRRGIPIQEEEVVPVAVDLPGLVPQVQVDPDILLRLVDLLIHTPLVPVEELVVDGPVPVEVGMVDMVQEDHHFLVEVVDVLHLVQILIKKLDMKEQDMVLVEDLVVTLFTWDHHHQERMDIRELLL